MMLIWWPGMLSVLLILIDFRFTILMDQPSICMWVTSSSSVCFSTISNGPEPCVILLPDRMQRYNARPSQFLQAINYIFPSLQFWCEKTLPVSIVQTDRVSHTSLSPAMQLVAFRQTKPRYFFFKEQTVLSLRSVSTVFVLLSSSSSQLPVVFQLLLIVLISDEFSVKLSNFFLSSFIGRKKLRKPTRPQSTLLMKAQGVLIFQTVQTTLASRPMPTQLENTFFIVFSSLWYYLQSLISQILPFLYVQMLTSQISQVEIDAFIHFFNCESRFSRRKSKFSAGQSIVLQKSLPVPIGMIPKAHLARLSSYLTSQFKTQLKVPSPPQTITLTSIFPSAITAFKFYISAMRLSLLNKSTKVSLTLLVLPKRWSKLTLRQEMICCPSRLPLLVLTKKKK